jgi:chemotaxis protein MotB
MRNIIGMALFAALALACGVSKDQFAAQQRDAQENLAKYNSEAEKTAALEKKVAELQQQNATLQQQNATLQQQLAAATESSKKLAQEKGALEAKSAQYEQLNTSLQKEIASGQVELSELKGKMTVKLKDRVLFSSASASLNKQGKVALDAIADAFKDLKGKNVVVAGYTDDVPIGTKSGFEDNWALSTARAVNVVRYLQSKGVSPAVLGAAGFSEYRPVVPNDSTSNRSQNRRIEIALTAADYTPPVVAAPK